MNTRMKDRIDELLDLIEVEPERLRAAEFINAQAALESFIGKTVAAATVAETRITLTASDGSQYHFYGFLGVEHAR